MEKTITHNLRLTLLPLHMKKHILKITVTAHILPRIIHVEMDVKQYNQQRALLCVKPFSHGPPLLLRHHPTHIYFPSQPFKLLTS